MRTKDSNRESCQMLGDEDHSVREAPEHPPITKFFGRSAHFI